MLGKVNNLGQRDWSRSTLRCTLGRMLGDQARGGGGGGRKVNEDIFLGSTLEVLGKDHTCPPATLSSLYKPRQ